MIKIKTLLLNLICISLASAQNISGNLSQLSERQLQLVGFNGLNTYPIDATILDKQGQFELAYSQADYGVGYLISTDKKPLFVILSGEDVEIVGEALSLPPSIIITKGQENKWFEAYAKAQPKREQALTAWIYLENIYAQDEEFAQHQQAIKAIQQEKTFLKDKSKSFIASLPSNSYVKWFLPIRKLVSNVSTIAQYRPKEIPEAIAAFRDLDYTDQRLYKSGLFKEAIENHFWLLENSGQPLEGVFNEMKRSIDAMMDKLVFDNEKLNQVTEHLFDVLERQSLFEASEYLALKVLNETSCTLDSDLAKQLETYRAMKKGNTAPNIKFKAEQTIFPDQNYQSLDDIPLPYTLVVFGASWCPKCQEEIPELANYYKSWQEEGVELVLVSLDENQAEYKAFVKDFPFISTCDYQKWNGQIVNDYYVFSTPTMYLLNSEREIVLRPNSIEQIEAWVDWYLVKENQ